jgi:hypothetical protein
VASLLSAFVEAAVVVRKRWAGVAALTSPLSVPKSDKFDSARLRPVAKESSVAVSLPRRERLGWAEVGVPSCRLCRLAIRGIFVGVASEMRL